MSDHELKLDEGIASNAVLLLSMPMANPHHPAIGLSLIQASLRTAGIKADIKHLYLDFVELIGPEAYAIVADERYFMALVGEWLFADAVIADPASDLAYLNKVLQGEHRDFLTPSRLTHLLAVRTKIQFFLDQCDANISWDRYNVIGFSSSFQQTMATIAMAKRIKTRYPSKHIILGGANAEGAMGRELLRLYSCIDVVVGGEAEHLVVGIVNALFRGEAPPNWPGVQTRKGARLLSPPSPVPQHLDQLPRLDYRDFVDDRARCIQTSKHFRMVALFESARGCWWGAKQHCTFCGLNGDAMAFRSKSAARAASELADLSNAYGAEILVVDNILDHSYFATLLPMLATLKPALVMHCEVKANLNETQVHALAQAGFHKLQPGIESLSSPILTLMRKGITAIRNIQTLKLAAEAGVFIDWSHLYGFPGETNLQYKEIAALIPSLLHLQAPSGANIVRADRFSPYWREPQRFEIQISPMPAYGFIHRDPSARLEDLAYHFRIIMGRPHELLEAWDEFLEALNNWIAKGDATLTIDTSTTGRTTVEDGRGETLRHIELDSLTSELLNSCATITIRRALFEHLRLGFEEKRLDDAYRFLVEERLLLEEAGLLLSLPLRQPGLPRAPAAHMIGTSFLQSFAANSAFLN